MKPSSVVTVVAFALIALSGTTLASSSPDVDVAVLSNEKSITISATASDQVKPTLLVGVVGLPGVDLATIPAVDLDVYGGKRSISKTVKAAAKKAAKATPTLTKATQAVNAIKGVPAVMALTTAVTYGAPVAWSLGSKIGEKVYGQPAGPYPGIKAAVLGK